VLSSGGSQGPSLRCLGAGDREGAVHTASLGERPEQSGGPRRGENLQRSDREEAGLSGRGNSCPAEVVGGDCGIQRSQRHAGTGLPKPRGNEHTAHPLEALQLSALGTEPGPTLKVAQSAAGFGRHSTARTLGLGSMPIRAPLSKPAPRRSRKSARPWNFLALALGSLT
jgi:hypothetical protein